MAEAETPATPATEAVAETPKQTKEAPKPTLDSSVDLARQTDKLIKLMPEAKDAESEGDSKEEKPEETKTEAKEAAAETEDDGESENELDLGRADQEIVELPPWQKYIMDKLPTIQALGHTSNGKDKIFTVKRFEELPDGFEFANQGEQTKFMRSEASQELNARDLLKQYQQTENDNKVQEFLNVEAQDIQKDIATLQKEGLLAKFEHESDAPEFNDDPAVQEANKIYDIYQKTNQRYVKEGRTYRISYRDAADKYYAQQARDSAKKEPVKEDTGKAERDKVAAKVSAPAGTTPDKGKYRMPPGANMRDFLKLYNSGRLG